MNMRLVWFLCLSFAAFGQQAGSVTGRIVDESGDPVSGATVTVISNTGQEVHTGTSDSGSYTFDRLAPGTYQVRAAMIAMKDYLAKGVIVKPGETVRLDITLLLPEGNLGTLGEEDRFTASAAAMLRRKPIPKGPTPRMPNGKPDLSGFWVGDALAAPAEPPQLLPKAESLRQQRQKNAMRDLPTASCLPGGIIDPAGRGSFVQTPDLLVMLIGPPIVSTYFEVRQIFLDARPHPKDGNSTWMGHSAGHWEGDSLVIDTTGFNDQAWYAFGLSSTGSLHVIERYRRPDLGHLELEMTVDDPAVLRKPWKQQRTSHLVPGEEIEEYVCPENNKDVEHLK